MSASAVVEAARASLGKLLVLAGATQRALDVIEPGLKQHPDNAELLAKGEVQWATDEVVGDVGSYLLSSLIEVSGVHSQIIDDRLGPQSRRHLSVQKTRRPAPEEHRAPPNTVGEASEGYV